MIASRRGDRSHGGVRPWTGPRRLGPKRYPHRVCEIIAKLHPILRGWGNYFRTGNASAKFNALDRYVRMRLLRVLERRGGQRRPNYQWKDWPHSRLVEEQGLHKLLGTIQYPGGTHAA